MSHVSRKFSAVEFEGRWDPEFYDKRYGIIKDALLATGAEPLSAFVAQANRGTGPRYDASGSVRVINSVNVRSLELSDERQSYVSAAELRANPTAAVHPGDLVVTSTGIGTLGRTFCSVSKETFFADGHITVVRLKDKRMGAYLSAFLQSPLGRAQFVQRRRGSSRQVELYPEDIVSVLVPKLPNDREWLATEWLAAVKEIARANSIYPEAEKRVLDELEWEKIEAAHSSNHFKSTFSVAQVANRWDAEFYAPRVSKLDDALASRGALRFHELEKSYVKGVQPEMYTQEPGITVIKSKDVLKGGINLGSCDRALTKHLDGDQGRVEPGMLVVNMTGVGTLGRAAVVPPSEQSLVVSVDVSAWRIKNEFVPAEYIALFLNSAAGMTQTLRYQTGSSGQLHLYPEHIRNLRVFVKQTASGEVDRHWHLNLARDVRRAASARLAANARLVEIDKRLATIVGVSPRIARE